MKKNIFWKYDTDLIINDPKWPQITPDDLSW